MFSQLCPGFVFLVLTFVKSGLSIGDLHFGITLAEKVAKGICWLENDKSADSTCDANMDLVVLYKSLIVDFKTHWGKYRKQETLTAEHEDKTVSQWLKSRIDRKLGEFLPGYHPCSPKVNKKSPQSPVKNYGSLLGDKEEGQYPFRRFNHCLLGLAESKHGEQALSDLKTNWGGTESAKDGEKDEVVALEEAEYAGESESKEMVVEEISS